MSWAVLVEGLRLQSFAQLPHHPISNLVVAFTLHEPDNHNFDVEILTALDKLLEIDVELGEEVVGVHCCVGGRMGESERVDGSRLLSVDVQTLLVCLAVAMSEWLECAIGVILVKR